MIFPVPFSPFKLFGSFYCFYITNACFFYIVLVWFTNFINLLCCEIWLWFSICIWSICSAVGMEQKTWKRWCLCSLFGVNNASVQCNSAKIYQNMNILNIACLNEFQFKRNLAFIQQPCSLSWVWYAFLVFAHQKQQMLKLRSQHCWEVARLARPRSQWISKRRKW